MLISNKFHIVSNLFATSKFNCFFFDNSIRRRRIQKEKKSNEESFVNDILQQIETPAIQTSHKKRVVHHFELAWNGKRSNSYCKYTQSKLYSKSFGFFKCPNIITIAKLRNFFAERKYNHFLSFSFSFSFTVCKLHLFNEPRSIILQTCALFPNGDYTDT